MTILENFLKSKKVQKTLSAKPGEEGFSLVELVVVIAVLAILSAVAVPAFVGVQANARASAAKNGLANILKECIVRDADNKSTTFADAQSGKGNYSGYTLSKWTKGTLALTDSCYAAQAEADKTKTEADFFIEMNTATGEVFKTCTYSTDVTDAPGCTKTKNSAGKFEYSW
ncbi:prepilin-type N-terminal cleavage/methylation domain-containing protein [Prochlorococcus marinus]|uniref:prepilin-type N-terminal cleavage/methylation domain-containing protein n=1 Tax=Prochlorococcus marinus TaxID=1219 RepID=UPI001ADD2A1E|nr:prepilin-type N-terminal cleavage/methylation domain-containing protein [Prochlorococcus marinus]MBO8204258.1 prepilin-type N-terminal cleavage/methylation domain-containing protein [Prochlorococcus marinus CUG1415]MBW3043559.1 hypothetical protein [Prochlorococcus marinus str. MU1415]